MINFIFIIFKYLFHVIVGIFQIESFHFLWNSFISFEKFIECVPLAMEVGTGRRGIRSANKLWECVRVNVVVMCMCCVKLIVETLFSPSRSSSNVCHSQWR